MVTQAYFDESYTDGGAYVIAGYLARVEDWAKFSYEWEELLPSAIRGKNNKHRFKMSEMASAMNRVPPFYEVIRRNAAFGFSVKIDAGDLERAKARIWSDNIEIAWTPDDSVAILLMRLFVPTFFDFCWQDERIREWLNPGEKIDLYFDTHTMSGWVEDNWLELIQGIPEHIQDMVGDSPRFVDDEEFLPIQAADFWAWWVREGYETDRIEEIITGDFGAWKSEKVPGNRIFINEDHLTKTLIALLKKGAAIPGLINIFDSKTHPRKDSAFTALKFEKKSNFLAYLGSKLRAIRKRRPS